MNNKPWPQQPHFLRILFLGVFLTNLLFGAIGTPVVGAAGDRVTSADGTSSPANSLRGSWQNPTNQLNALAAAQAVSKTTALQTEQLKNKARDLYNNSNLRFEPNQGQVSDGAVKFVARGKGYNFYLGADEFNFALVKSDKTSQAQNDRQTNAATNANSTAVTTTPPLANGLAAGKLPSKLRQTQNLLNKTAAQSKTSAANQTGEQSAAALAQGSTSNLALLQLKLVGANKAALAKGEQTLKTTTNYIGSGNTANQSAGSGSAAKTSLKNVPSYGQIHYSEIYPGVDLTFYSNSDKNLEYDFVVTPGADPNAIKLDFKGADKLELDDKGTLVLHVGDERLFSTAPVVYQLDSKGNRHDITSSYIVSNDQQVSFKLGNYDRQRALVIDPSIVYATFFNGNDYDALNAVTVDKDGNVYAAGTSLSIDLRIRIDPTVDQPINFTNNNVFYVKYNRDFTNIAFNYLFTIPQFPDDDPNWHTSIASNDGANAIAVDNQGNLYLAGYTSSISECTNRVKNPDTGLYQCFSGPFPITRNNAYQCDIALDQNGLVTTDGFITKISVDSSTILYSSYFGGSVGEDITGLAADPNGNYVIIAGVTNSLDLTQGHSNVSTGYDGFVAKIELNTPSPCQKNSADYIDYIGGTGDDFVWDLKTDSVGNAYVVGTTRSSDFKPTPPSTALQTTNPGEGGFLTKLSSTGSALYSTYLTGNGGADAFSVALDNDNHVYIAGLVGTGNFTGFPFPYKNGYDSQMNSLVDGFLTVLDLTQSGDASLLYSTYLGGNGSTENEVWSVATLGSGNAFVTGFTNAITSTTNPTLKPFPLRNELEETYSHVNSGQSGDAFFSYINTQKAGDASLVESTYLGGSNLDFGASIAVDTSANVYIVGYTYSSDFPVNNGTTYNPNGSYSTTDCSVHKDQPIAPVNKDPYLSPPSNSQCHQQDAFFVKLTLSQTTPLGGCDGGAVRATQFVPVGFTSEQLNCQVVDPNDGNYAASVTDLSLAAPPEAAGLSINFGRHYNSQDTTAGTMGIGWRHSYEWNVEATDNYVTITTPTGRKDGYPASGIGVDIGATNKYGDGSLVKNAFGVFKLTTLDKTIYRFRDGKLIIIDDRYQNELKFSYDQTSGMLTQIDLCLAGPCGTPVQTLKVQNDGNGHISGVSVEGGAYPRSVSYKYTNNLLTKVTDVRLKDTTLEYYPTGDPNQTLLKKITDPLQHTLTNITYLNANNISRVTKISTTVDGADSSTSFDYSVPDQTTVTDPRLNKSTYYFTGSAKPSSPRRTTKVTDAEGHDHTFKYNDKFQIAASTDGNNNLTTYNYNEQGLQSAVVRTVTTAVGVTLYINSTEYNSQNQPVKISDNRGSTTIDYQPDGNRIKTVTDQRNNTLNYDYNAGNQIKDVISSNGLTVKYFYDAAGFPQQVKHSFSTLRGTSTTPTAIDTIVDYTYNDQDGRLVDQSDVYYSDESAAPHVQYGYDAAGHITSFTNQIGKSATKDYDDAGNLWHSINYLGQTTTFSAYNEVNQPKTVMQAVSSGNLTTQYSYDPAGNLKKVIDPKQVETDYDYDKLNRRNLVTTGLVGGGTVKTTMAYDGVGNLTSLTQDNNTNGGPQTTAYKYDEVNRVILTTLSLGYTLSYGYDEGGNLTSVIRNDGNGDQPIQSAQYDELNRLQKQIAKPGGTSPDLTTIIDYNDTNNTRTVTDPDGIVTTYQSDAAGRVYQIKVDPNPANSAPASSQTSYMAYNASNQVVHTVDPLGYWTETAYDELHRAKKNTVYTGVNGAGPLDTITSYDDSTATPKVTVTGPTHTSSGQMNDTANVVQTMQYDEAGRLLSADDGILATSYTYDGQGNVLTEADPLKTTSYTYDNTGWLLKTSQSFKLPGATSPTVYDTSFTYDLVGNQTSVTNARGKQSTATYDALNRLVGTMDAVGNPTSRAYEGLNRKMTYTDGKGQTSVYLYDNIGRLNQIASANNLVTTFSYTGNQLTSMQDQASSTTYQYDGLDRVFQVTSPQGSVQYGYDNANRRNALTFTTPQGGPAKSVSYDYDGLDRLKTVSGNWWNGQFSYSYDGERLSQLTYPNGVAASYKYDKADRLSQLNYQSSSVPNLFSATYQRDPLGNPTQLNEVVANTTHVANYTYDGLSRLWTETHQIGTTGPVLTNNYIYDKMGNRTSAVLGQPNGTTVNNTYMYDDADRLITTTSKASNARTGSVTTYGYDKNNSLVRENYTGPAGSGGYTNQYTYDGRNRLTSVQKQQSGSTTVSTVSYSYDGANTRLSQTAGSLVTNYLQDTVGGLPVVLQETTTGGSSPTGVSYAYGGGSTSPLMQKDQNNLISYFHPDVQGSIRVATSDGTPSVQATYTYNAFGQLIAQTNPVSVAAKHGFTGEEQDSTGLIYDRARYYNPALGRFISEDSFGGDGAMPTTLNRYTYAGDSPATYSDPSGHCFIICAAVGAVVGAAFGYGSQVIGNLQHGQGWDSFGNVDWGKVAISAAVGAVAGGTGGLASGALGAVGMGSWGVAALSGAAGQVAGGQTERAIDNVLNGRNALQGLFNPEDMLGDAGQGALFGVGFEAVGSLGSSVWKGLRGDDNFYGIRSSTETSSYFSADPVKLSTKQQGLLSELQKSGDFVIRPKKMIRISDMISLSAHEEVEFALFTRGGERLLMRGSYSAVPFTAGMAKKWAQRGWRWSGHVHPHRGYKELQQSGTPEMNPHSDQGVLWRFSQYGGQQYSTVYDWDGNFKKFRADEGNFNPGLDWGELPTWEKTSNWPSDWEKVEQ